MNNNNYFKRKVIQHLRYNDTQILSIIYKYFYETQRKNFKKYQKTEHKVCPL